MEKNYHDNFFTYETMLSTFTTEKFALVQFCLSKIDSYFFSFHCEAVLKILSD